MFSRLARWVINLSDKVLTSAQEEVLKVGLNFAPVPTKVPLQDTIVEVEEAARQLPKDDAIDLLTQMCGFFRSSKLPKDSITKEQRLAVKEVEGGGDPAGEQGEWYCTHEEE